MKIPKLYALAFASVALSTQASAITIGYYDTSRELWGFDGGGGYLSSAKQWLLDKGHTLVTTNNVDAAFLSGVDAFYTGLISSVNASEISAFEDFVNVQGGFLFIQTDWADGTWTSAANSILSNWGIAHGGSYSNDFGHTTVGSSDWVSNPNAVAGFTGAQHSVVTNAPADFEILAKDDAGLTIMGVFDAGGGRSSDVLIATDINFWDDQFGWADSRNRDLWENIWSFAADQVDPPPTGVPDAGSTFAMFAGVFGVLAGLRRRRRVS